MVVVEVMVVIVGVAIVMVVIIGVVKRLNMKLYTA